MTMSLSGVVKRYSNALGLAPLTIIAQQGFLVLALLDAWVDAKHYFRERLPAHFPIGCVLSIRVNVVQFEEFTCHYPGAHWLVGA